jgi:hypothetical protein
VEAEGLEKVFVEREDGILHSLLSVSSAGFRR